MLLLVVSTARGQRAHRPAHAAAEAGPVIPPAVPPRPHEHGPDTIAVFGGNPPKHREQANRRLAPFESLVLFGSPRDTGSGDTKRLVNAIRNGKLDVVYNWSKFGNHASRKMIQVACQKAPGDVVFKDVSTLDMLQWQRQD